MEFEQGGCSYKLIFATDVCNDGYWLEMYECSQQGTEVIVMTAFRPFGTRSVHISMHIERLDFEAVKFFLDAVKTNLVDLIEPPDPEADA